MNAFPRKIYPAEHRPHSLQAEVRKAMRDRYKDQIWRWRGQVVRLDHATGELAPLDRDTFQAMALKAVVFVERKGRGKLKNDVEFAPDVRVLKDVYHDPELAPVLLGVRRCPWVEADGRLVVRPGYDAQSKLWLHWEGEPCDGGATDDEVVDVLDRLLDLSFKDEASRVNYLAMLLRSVRHLQGHACPMSVLGADAHTSGKSLGARLLGLVLLGHEPRLTTLPDGMERKYTLAALVAQERPLLWFDNLTTGSLVGGQELQATATANGPIEGRAVRSSSMVAGDPTLTHFVLTGNSLSYDAEQARRMLICYLVPRAAGRSFKTPDLVGWVLTNRRLVVNVLLRLVLRWYEAGCPDPPRSLESFEGWSRLIGGPLCMRPVARRLWLTDRPVGALEKELDELFRVWGPKPLAASNVLELATTLCLPNVILEGGQGGPRAVVTRFGAFLGNLTKRVRPILGWRLEARKIKNGKGYLPVRCGEPTSEGPSPGGAATAEDPSCRTSPDPPPGGAATAEDPSCRTSQDRSAGGAPVTDEPVEPAENPAGGSAPGGAHAADRRNPGNLGSAPTTCGVRTSPKDAEPPPPRVCEEWDDPSSVVGGGKGSAPPSTPREGAACARLRRGNLGSPEVPQVPPEVRHTHLVRLFDPEDTLQPYLLRVALRGVRVDPERWDELWHAAEEDLLRRDTPEDRDRLKNLRSYAPEIWRQAQTGERLICHWEEQGAGRFGTVRPCLQQVTKGYGLRSAIVPEPGHVFIHGDWRSSHVWVAAGASGDELLLLDLSRGNLYEDAARIWGCTPEKAKICILALLNGEGAGKLAERLEVSPREARRRRREWLSRYPKLQAWLEGLQGVRSWTTPLGRLVALPEEKGDYTVVGWTMQSIEADALRRVLMTATFPIVFTAHDEVMLEVREEDRDEARAELQTLMDAALLEMAGLPRDQGLTTARVEARRAWRET